MSTASPRREPEARRAPSGASALVVHGAPHPPSTSRSDNGHRRPESRSLIGEAPRGQLHVMSFNIRADLDVPAGHPDHWPDREPLVSRLLELELPTVLGVQEALFHQLRAIEDGLPQRYRTIGHGREGGSRGELCPIFYDPARVRLQAWEQWWLSETPEVIGSRSWGNTIPRIAVWARFTELATDRVFTLVNTHLDHESDRAREQSAAMLVQRIRRDACPTLVTGDFNTAAERSASWEQLTRLGRLSDTWTSATRRLSPATATFLDYAEAEPDGARIDWILASPGVRVLSAAINTTTFLGRYPSDHAPVQALVRL